MTNRAKQIAEVLSVSSKKGTEIETAILNQFATLKAQGVSKDKIDKAVICRLLGITPMESEKILNLFLKSNK